MFEKLVLNIDYVSVDGADCHPPPFFLKDGCYIQCLVTSMQCEILTRMLVPVAPYQLVCSSKTDQMIPINFLSSFIH